MVRPKIAQRLRWCGHVATSTDEEITVDSGCEEDLSNRSMSFKMCQTSDHCTEVYILCKVTMMLIVVAIARQQ